MNLFSNQISTSFPCGLAAALIACNLPLSPVLADAYTGSAYEGFDYAAGSDLSGQNGGTGWASPWAGTKSGDEMKPQALVREGSLDGSFVPVPKVGNHGYVVGAIDGEKYEDAEVFRSLTGKSSKVDAGAVWISFVAQRESPGARDSRLRLLNTHQEVVAVRLNQDFRLEGRELQPVERPKPGHGLDAKEPTFAVLHIEFNVEGKLDPSQKVDRATLYLAPASNIGDAPEFNVGTDSVVEGPAGSLVFDRIALMGGEGSSSSREGYGAASYDEIRVGPTYESVRGQ